MVGKKSTGAGIGGDAPVLTGVLARGLPTALRIDPLPARAITPSVRPVAILPFKPAFGLPATLPVRALLVKLALCPAGLMLATLLVRPWGAKPVTPEIILAGERLLTLPVVPVGGQAGTLRGRPVVGVWPHCQSVQREGDRLHRRSGHQGRDRWHCQYDQRGCRSVQRVDGRRRSRSGQLGSVRQRYRWSAYGKVSGHRCWLVQREGDQ